MQAINAVRDQHAAAADGARVLPLWRGSRVDILPEADLERIRMSVLRVLEDTGIRIGSTRLLDDLRAAGAAIEVEAGLARFPEALVEDALRAAPRDLLLAARDPACDLRVDGASAWLTTGGRAATVADLATSERRAPGIADVAAIARLIDAVPQIGFAGPPPAATDVQGARALHELHAQLTNTSKHVQIEGPADVPTAEAVIEVARVVAGDEPALRSRPVLSAVVPVTEPLSLPALDPTLALARAGIPSAFVPLPRAATLAGVLVHSMADTIAGAVVLQLLAPGAPTFVGAAASEPSVAPRFQMAWAQLARRFGVRASVGAFATTATSSDWRAGVQSGLSGTVAWMAPPDLLAAAGLRDGGRLFSSIAMLLDTELFDLIRQVPLGFDVDEETLAVDVIDEVGPAEHFLGEQHTLHHFRETWTSRFMDTSTWEAWEELGRPEPPEHAAAVARALLETPQPAPLPISADDRIREVIAEHERDRG